jgi:GH24 family phage-related lysozyme (muramidase)
MTADEMLRIDLERQEGYRRLPYFDDKGHWTGGWGHRLDDDQLPDIGAKTFGDYLIWVSDPARHAAWFREDRQAALDDAKRFAGATWHDLHPCQQAALGNMAYQMGGTKLLKFIDMRSALRDRSDAEVVAEMRDSLWYREYTTRAKQVIARFEGRYA